MGCALLTRLRDAGLTVSRNGDSLVVTPRDRLTDELRETIRQQKAELLASVVPAPTVKGHPIFTAPAATLSRRIDADRLADFAAAIRSGALQQCHACRHFTRLIPANGDNLGVPDAGWCGRYQVATHPITPFYCDGYFPTSRQRGSK
jgi:hypothetical protein